MLLENWYKGVQLFLQTSLEVLVPQDSCLLWATLAALLSCSAISIVSV
jgi:hypothetical protein